MESPRTGKLVRIYKSLYEVIDLSSYDKLICHKRKSIPRLEVGDQVVFESGTPHGTITAFEPRRNLILRPRLANIDVVLVVMAMTQPDLQYFQVDSFLAYFTFQGVNPILIFTKKDLASPDIQKPLKRYEYLGYDVIYINALNLSAQDHNRLKGKIAHHEIALAGPSGVGKSTLIKALFPDMNIRTGNISERLNRGKQTTKQVSLYPFHNSFIADTPGYSMVHLPDLKDALISELFPEFQLQEEPCRFSNCRHLKEPDCVIKQAVESGEIFKSRYQSYVKLVETVENWRKKCEY